MLIKSDYSRMMHHFLYLILFCGIKLCFADILECTYKNDYYLDEEASFYTCGVKTLDNKNNKMMIIEASKSHLQNQSDYDVKKLVISNTNTDFLPDGLGNLFNLTSLMVYSTSLKEIHTKNFVGMDGLEFLYLAMNQLIFLSKDSFSTLKILKEIDLSQNHLQALESNLFANNILLDSVSLQKNEISFINSDLFKHLTKLKFVDLRYNKCVNKVYSEVEGIIELNNNDFGKCKKLELLDKKNKTENFNSEIRRILNDCKLETQNIIELHDNLMACDELENSYTEINERLDLPKVNLKDKDGKEYCIETKLNSLEIGLINVIKFMNEFQNITFKYQNEESEKVLMEEKCKSEILKLKNDQKLEDVLLAEVKNQLENAQKLSIEEMKDLQSTINILKNEKLSLQHQIEGCQTEFENYKLKKKPDSDILTLQSMNTQLDGQNLELQNQINDLNAQINLSNKKHNYLTCEYSDHWSDYTCNGKFLQIYNDNSEIYIVIGKHSNWKKTSDVVQLRMENSEMFYVPKNLFKIFNNLQTVYFQKINLKFLSRGNFNGASELKSLFINKNQIKSLDDNIFDGANNLESIDMSSNEIEKISAKTFESLRKLKQLSLMNNLIKELDIHVFKNLINLNFLNLSLNKLKYLDGKLLQFNENLVNISFSRNELEEIGADILIHSKRLDHFDFTGNTCFKINLRSYLNKYNIIQEIKNNCRRT